MAQPEAALAAALAKINKTATPQDLKTSGPRLRALLADVLQEIDGSVSGDVDDQIALLRVLGLDPTPDLRDQPRGRPPRALPLLEFCTANVQAHKKRVYALRPSCACSRARRRAATARRPGRPRDAWARRRRRSRRGSARRARARGRRPEAWDLDKLAALAKIDGKETAAHPRRTMSQRWKASARRLAAKMLRDGGRGPAAATMFERFGEKPSPSCVVGKKPATDKEAPPKDCVHATEPGAVTPQLLWSYPRREPGELAGEVLPFCFPNGVRVERSKPDGDDDAFVFQLSLPDDGPAAAAAAGQSQSPSTASASSWASRATASGSFAVPRATCLLTRLLLDLHAAVLRDAGRQRRSRDRHLALRASPPLAAVEAPKPGMPAAFAADPARSPAAASVECSRSLVRGGFLEAGDQPARSARRSTNLRLDESIARDPMRRVFFERVAESQAYAVYRESFPTFAGFGVGADRQRWLRAPADRPAPAPKRDAGESPTSVDDDPLATLDDPSVITELGFEGTL
ncbi:hypothetical protein JL722_9299 [Aureococcus anophagefferens]|nr:hypothetical protein JL722_9299 [Aureococcus anophagefferens]